MAYVTKKSYDKYRSMGLPPLSTLLLQKQK